MSEFSKVLGSLDGYNPENNSFVISSSERAEESALGAGGEKHDTKLRSSESGQPLSEDRKREVVNGVEEGVKQFSDKYKEQQQFLAKYRGRQFSLDEFDSVISEIKGKQEEIEAGANAMTKYLQDYDLTPIFWLKENDETAKRIFGDWQGLFQKYKSNELSGEYDKLLMELEAQKSTIDDTSSKNAEASSPKTEADDQQVESGQAANTESEAEQRERLLEKAKEIIGNIDNSQGEFYLTNLQRQLSILRRQVKGGRISKEKLKEYIGASVEQTKRVSEGLQDVLDDLDVAFIDFPTEESDKLSAQLATYQAQAGELYRQALDLQREFVDSQSPSTSEQPNVDSTAPEPQKDSQQAANPETQPEAQASNQSTPDHQNGNEHASQNTAPDGQNPDATASTQQQVEGDENKEAEKRLAEQIKQAREILDELANQNLLTIEQSDDEKNEPDESERLKLYRSKTEQIKKIILGDDIGGIEGADQKLSPTEISRLLSKLKDKQDDESHHLYQELVQYSQLRDQAVGFWLRREAIGQQLKGEQDLRAAESALKDAEEKGLPDIEQKKEEVERAKKRFQYAEDLALINTLIELSNEPDVARQDYWGIGKNATKTGRNDFAENAMYQRRVQVLLTKFEQSYGTPTDPSVTMNNAAENSVLWSLTSERLKRVKSQAEFELSDKGRAKKARIVGNWDGYNLDIFRGEIYSGGIPSDYDAFAKFLTVEKVLQGTHYRLLEEAAIAEGEEEAVIKNIEKQRDYSYEMIDTMHDLSLFGVYSGKSIDIESGCYYQKGVTDKQDKDKGKDIYEALTKGESGIKAQAAIARLNRLAGINATGYNIEDQSVVDKETGLNLGGALQQVMQGVAEIMRETHSRYCVSEEKLTQNGELRKLVKMVIDAYSQTSEGKESFGLANKQFKELILETAMTLISIYGLTYFYSVEFYGKRRMALRNKKWQDPQSAGIVMAMMYKITRGSHAGHLALSGIANIDQGDGNLLDRIDEEIKYERTNTSEEKRIDDIKNILSDITTRSIEKRIDEIKKLIAKYTAQKNKVKADELNQLLAGYKQDYRRQQLQQLEYVVELSLSVSTLKLDKSSGNNDRQKYMTEVLDMARDARGYLDNDAEFDACLEKLKQEITSWQEAIDKDDKVQLYKASENKSYNNEDHLQIGMIKDRIADLRHNQATILPTGKTIEEWQHPERFEQPEYIEVETPTKTGFGAKIGGVFSRKRHVSPEAYRAYLESEYPNWPPARVDKELNRYLGRLRQDGISFKKIPNPEYRAHSTQAVDYSHSIQEWYSDGAWNAQMFSKLSLDENDSLSSGHTSVETWQDSQQAQQVIINGGIRPISREQATSDSVVQTLISNMNSQFSRLSAIALMSENAPWTKELCISSMVNLIHSIMVAVPGSYEVSKYTGSLTDSGADYLRRYNHTFDVIIRALGQNNSGMKDSFRTEIIQKMNQNKDSWRHVQTYQLSLVHNRETDNPFLVLARQYHFHQLYHQPAMTPWAQLDSKNGTFTGNLVWHNGQREIVWAKIDPKTGEFKQMGDFPDGFAEWANSPVENILEFKSDNYWSSPDDDTSKK